MRYALFFLLATLVTSNGAFAKGENRAPTPEIPAQAPLLKPLLNVDPKMRAADYQEAFELLRKEKAISKIGFLLSGGKTITHIIDIQIMSQGTLLLFKINTPQGITFQVVEVEKIVALYHL